MAAQIVGTMGSIPICGSWGLELES